MIELKSFSEVWSLSDRSEANVVIRGNQKKEHPLQRAIKEAEEMGFEITKMDSVKIFPERGPSYESPAIILFNREEQRYSAIIQKESFLIGNTYKIVTY